MMMAAWGLLAGHTPHDLAAPRTLMLAVAAFFWANRLLPVDMAGRRVLLVTDNGAVEEEGVIARAAKEIRSIMCICT